MFKLITSFPLIVKFRVYYFFHRWDLQRFREQRRYEKLRARYEGEDRSQDRVRTQAPAELSTTSGTQCGTLWAGPEDVTHIQVEPWLPVSVFGIPLPNIGPA